jgi:hyperosmotically inducible periplasmic protein
MRAIRTLFVLLLLVEVGVLAYNYWSGYGWTLQPPRTSGRIDAEKAREKGAEIGEKAAAGAKTAAERTKEIVGDAALTAKIKSKMALDDYVKARTINVDSNGPIVTLTGTVQSEREHERAVRLARETAGVTEVVDHLRIAK